MTITPESVQPLLASENFGDRIKGLNQLRQLPPESAFPLIKPLCQDRSERIRYAAISQLDRLGEVNRQETLDILRHTLLEDPETDVKAAAADVIGALKLTEALTDLKTTYETTQEWVLQMSIVATLGAMGDLSVLDILKMALASENGLIQTAAISSLGELAEPAVLPLLLPFVENPDWQIRFRLAIALSHFADPAAQQALQTLAQDTFEQVAETAQRLITSPT
ncbi:MAG: phycobilisome degradation protein NblB [Microcystis aeruginosa]